MATQVQFRRGTTTQNNAFTGANGEISVDTDIRTLRIHDGTTGGGSATLMNTTTAQTALNKTFSSGSVWTGNAVALAYGGTGSSLTAVQGAVAYSGASGFGLSAAGTSGQVLVSGGTGSPVWVNASSLTTGTATVATTATNIAGGSAGQLIIQSDTNLSTFITAGAEGTFLKSAGAGYAPTWAAGQVTIGSTAVSLGATVTSYAGLNILASTGTSHWTLPAGTTEQRPGSPAVGMMRYNSSISGFEGYASGAWSSLGGVKSVDAYTYILAETSAGAGNGDLDFYAENSGGNGATQVGQWNRTNLKDYTGTLVGTQTTQNVFNATATTVNAFGAATTLAIGNATSATLTLRPGTVVGSNTTQNLYNTVATTLNLGGEATTVSIGAATGTTSVNNNLTVTGNLTINGTTTTINATSLAIDDNIIRLAEGNAANIVDIGFVGNYTSGSALHTGLIKQASSSKWLLISGVAEPTNTVSLTGVVYDWLKLGTVEVTTSAVFTGSTSGTTTVQASATAGTTTLTLPAATDTLVGKATTDTLTNKSISLTNNTVTFTSLELKTACSDETGSGALVFATSPTLVTPTLGVATATSINGLTVSTTTGTLTLANSSTLATSGAYSTTLTATATTTLTLPTTGTLATLAGTETLSNKTLSAAVLTGTLTAGGGVGTNGQFLQSTSTGVQWASVSGTITLASGSGSGSVSTGGTLTVSGGTGITTAASGSTYTISIPQAVGTSSSVQHGSLGIGTAASGTSGEIRATNQIVAYYSDDRLKTRGSNIENALEKVLSLNGFHYEANETAQALGYVAKPEVGVSAQEVQAIMPEVVVPAPIDEQYLTVHYDRLVPLLIEAIKEQQKQIEELKARLG
jgi:hypothetical protein